MDLSPVLRVYIILLRTCISCVSSTVYIDRKLLFICLHFFSHCSSIVQSEGNFPHTAEEVEESKDESVEKEAGGSGDLLSCVQALEDKLKDSEQKNIDNELSTQEEKGHLCQELTSLKGEKSELEIQISALKKMLIQQVEQYMEMTTKVHV